MTGSTSTTAGSTIPGRSPLDREPLDREPPHPALQNPALQNPGPVPPGPAEAQLHTDHPSRSAPRLDGSMRFLSRPPAPPTVALGAAYPDAPRHTEPDFSPPAQPETSLPTRADAPCTRSAQNLPENAVEVRRSVEVTLRMILEILDRRRRPEHLSRLAETAVVDTVRTLSLGSPPGSALGAAALRRIHIAPAGPAVVAAGRVTTRTEPAVEVCASYTRGRRTLAIAGHFRRSAAGWRCTALHLA